MEIVLLGHMGRDDAVAERLTAQQHRLHVIGEWENPGLTDKAHTSGGQAHMVDSVTHVDRIADIVDRIDPDMFYTNFDAALAAGVVDAVRRRRPDVLTPCPDQAAARVEWDKFFLRDLIKEIDPRYNPENFMADNIPDAAAAVAHFRDTKKAVVVKPRNLTGGKGVKVMGKHLDTYEDVEAYARQVLADPRQRGVEVQERLDGHEFTLQILTDGSVLIEPPATYDYPYREDGDTGPGTGGMGAFSMQHGEQLPFLTDADYDEAMTLMHRLLGNMKEKGIDYKGVLYPTFFKTGEGLRIVEINARGGDPEFINTVDLLADDVDLGEVLRLIALGELTPDSVRYKKLASAMLYLVAPDYGYTTGPSYEFGIDHTAITGLGCRVRFAAAERAGSNGRYRTVGSSRVVGLSALGVTPWAARAQIHNAIAAGFSRPLALQYRREVADKAYITSLA